MDTDEQDDFVNLGVIASPALEALTVLCNGEASNLGSVLKSLLDDLDLTRCRVYKDVKFFRSQADEELSKNYSELQTLAERFAPHDIGYIINLLLVQKLVTMLPVSRPLEEEWTESTLAEAAAALFPSTSDSQSNFLLCDLEPLDMLFPKTHPTKKMKTRNAYKPRKPRVKKTYKSRDAKLKAVKTASVNVTVDVKEELNAVKSEPGATDDELHIDDDDTDDVDFDPGVTLHDKSDHDVSDEPGQKPPAKKRGRPRGVSSKSVKNKVKHVKGSKPFSCDTCEKRFSQQHYLDKHTCGREVSVCEQCGKTFTSKYGLKTHILVHQGVKAYPCSICDKRFVTQGALTIHVKRHLGEKPFTCEVCGWRFVSSGHLKIHIRTHTGERPYTCEVCGKTFISSGERTDHHRRWHVKDKRHKCEVCGRDFHSTSDLRKHVRLHTGEKPYMCSECGKCFREAGKLSRHKRVHTGEKRYACAECNKSYAKSDSLRNHNKVHHPEKIIAADKAREERDYSRANNRLSSTQASTSQQMHGDDTMTYVGDAEFNTSMNILFPAEEKVNVNQTLGSSASCT